MVMSAGGPMPPAAPRAKALNCPSCGAALTIRSFNNAVTVVCGSCHSILDAQDPRLKILQKFQAATDEDPPLIPLGSRGTIRGATYEVIGFQRRTIQVDGVAYSWHEYVLFNPYKGFRYLTEYNGHWNDVSILRSLPATPGGRTITYLGETYRRFQTARAETSFVLGEFPWQVRVGESAEVSDYVSPPRVISSEKTGNEITWSMGEYMTGRDLWNAFKLKGSAPAAIGVYENQPSPLSAEVKVVWTLVGAFLVVLVALMMFFYTIARDEPVFTQGYTFNTNNTKTEAAFVTDVFELKGRTSDVEVETIAHVDNNWIFLNYALISQDTGHAYDFGREVSYYHGYDSDGSWTEGRQKDTVTVPSIPPGHYYLRIEPESDYYHGTIYYSVSVRRDVPQLSFFGLGALALLIPAGFITWRSINFEHLRWAESDYAPGEGSIPTNLSELGQKVQDLMDSGDDE
jgi:Domain of unknown function (DUF4178)